MDSGVFFLFIIVAILFIFAIPYLGSAARSSKNEEIRSRVFSGDFVPADEFERNWVVKGFTGNYGSKYRDGPGCYIILIFSKPVLNRDYSDYEHGYIGQSINACSRVHNHLSGKGNGDVYADRKNGKYLYVKVVECSKAELNDLEIRLIGAFDYKRLYNKSRGGGSKHEGIPDSRYKGDFAAASLSADKGYSAPVTQVQQASSLSRGHDFDSVPEGSRPNSPLYPQLDYLKSRAVTGDVNSQYRLGQIYENGELGVQQDYFYAVMWYRNASDRGHQDAMYHLALMLRDGRGTPVNHDEYVRLLSILQSEGYFDKR